MWKNNTAGTQEESRYPKKMELRWDTILALLFQLNTSTLRPPKANLKPQLTPGILLLLS